MAQRPCQLRRERCQPIPPAAGALPRCKHGMGKSGWAAQLSHPPGIPRDAGAGLFSSTLNARFYSRSPGSAAVINPGHLPSRASTNAASLGLANKAITTREKSELIPECWRWALRCHIAPGRSGEAAGLGRLRAGQRGAHSHMETTSDLLGITAVIFPGRKPASQAWLVYLQPPERQGSSCRVQGRRNGFRKRSSSTDDAHGVRGVGVSPLPYGPAAVGRRV